MRRVQTHASQTHKYTKPTRTLNPQAHQTQTHTKPTRTPTCAHWHANRQSHVKKRSLGRKRWSLEPLSERQTREGQRQPGGGGQKVSERNREIEVERDTHTQPSREFVLLSILQLIKLTLTYQY